MSVLSVHGWQVDHRWSGNGPGVENEVFRIFLHIDRSFVHAYMVLVILSKQTLNDCIYILCVYPQLWTMHVQVLCSLV